MKNGDELIIPKDKSVIVAADVLSLESLSDLASAMMGVPGISSFKIGFSLGLQGLRTVANIVKGKLGLDFPVIYDHQKASNDIPDMGKQFAKVLKDSGIDAAILFPFTGPATQEAWTKACFEEDLQVITGGIMTHSQFLISEGGYIVDEAVEKIYLRACKLGVRHFVVPGNKIDWVKKIYSLLIERLGEGGFVLYAPGFVTQGGDISECGLAAGPKFHAIVGSAIYKQETEAGQRQAAQIATSKILT